MKKTPRRNRNGTFSAAQIHAMLRQAMVLTPPSMRIPRGSTGLSFDESHLMAHRDFTAIFPVYTRPPSKANVDYAEVATAHLESFRIDEDRPL